MGFPTVLSIPLKFTTSLPEKFSHDDVRYPYQLVEYIIDGYTMKGDKILDPFVGYGTTVTTANKMERIGYGVEIDFEVYNYLVEDLELTNITHGSLQTLDLSKFPKFDLLMTSPPYMGGAEDLNALKGWREKGSYKTYLKDMDDIFSKIKSIMQPNAKIVIEVSNLKHKGVVTTLAWDIGLLLSSIFKFEGEIIVNWEGERKENGIYGYGYDHSYCLIYSNYVF